MNMVFGSWRRMVDRLVVTLRLRCKGGLDKKSYNELELVLGTVGLEKREMASSQADEETSVKSLYGASVLTYTKLRSLCGL